MGNERIVAFREECPTDTEVRILLETEQSQSSEDQEQLRFETTVIRGSEKTRRYLIVVDGKGLDGQPSVGNFRLKAECTR